MASGCKSDPIDQPPTGTIEPPTGVRYITRPMAVVRDSALDQWLLANTERFYGSSISDSAFDIIAAGIGARRVVMLGAEDDAVAPEQTSLKVSIVRALHEQRGFNVLAFEGPLWSCTPVLNPSATYAWESLRDRCASTDWDASEIGDLFRYVESTQKTRHPLVLVGLEDDSSAESSVTVAVAGLVAPVDPVYAAEVRALDSTIVELLSQDLAKPLGPRKPVPFQIVQQLDSLTRRLSNMAKRETSRDDLAARYALAAATSRTRADIARVLGSFNGKVREIEDDVMAENLAFIADTLYPSQKVMVWSRNARIVRHKPPPGSYGTTRKNMGAVFERESPRNTPYSIALFAATRDGSSRRRAAALSSWPNSSIKDLLFDPFGRTVLLTTNPGGTTVGRQWLSRDVIAGRRDQQRQSLQFLDDYDAVLVQSTVTSATPGDR